MSFSSLGLSQPILDALAEKGYQKPSPVQAKAIPSVLEGRDLMAAAQTGTGKTAGFTLPILDLLNKGKSASDNQVRALILTPTRELAAQIGENVEAYGKNLTLKSAVVFGGVKINPQMMKLRKGVDILVATPGRLLDLYGQNAIKFDQLEILVLDEADRMLDMGFIHDIRKILHVLPQKRQNLMFSATFSEDIRKLAKGIVNNPVEFSVSPRNTTVESVEQWVYPVDKKQKSGLLIELIQTKHWHQVLVFSRTKHGANKLVKQLTNADIDAAAIHGNKSQGARTKALSNFKAGKIQVLVATDIAARGLDIDQLPQVVNFDLPNVPEDYVHRIGRTGRAGASGHAVSLVSADEIKQLTDIERLIQKLIPRQLIDGFEPVHDLPQSQLKPAKRVHKPKRAKKDKPSYHERKRANSKTSRNKSRGSGKQSSSKTGSSKAGSSKTDSSRTGSSRTGSGKPGGKSKPQTPKSKANKRRPSNKKNGFSQSKPRSK